VYPLLNFGLATSLNAVAIAIRLFAAFAVNKILAVYVGASGYALIGQLQNVTAALTMFAAGATNQGVTKLTAECQDDVEGLKLVWRAATAIALGCSGIVATLCIVFATPLATAILKAPELFYVFIIFGAGVLFAGFNLLLLAVANGLTDFRAFILANITGSIFTLSVSAGLTVTYGLAGGLIAFAIGQSIPLASTLWVCRHRHWLKWELFFGRVDRNAMGRLSGFIAMGVTTALATPLSQIAAREFVIGHFGLTYAGYWEAMNRISNLYLLFFTSTLSLAYLPALSAARDAATVNVTVYRMVVIFAPLTALCSFIVYRCQDVIIHILFTPEFSSMKRLFFYQTIGDTVKVVSWIFAYVMIGRGMAKAYILTEIILSLMDFT
jgi:polysaccharide transporter, PST family